MNDQRHVIFSQRYKILRNKNISTVLNDFFDEKIKDLEVSYTNYQKSKDEKYLFEIKNFIGNSISDNELTNLISKSKDSFSKGLRELFFEKQKSRIELLGKDQNINLEKKIFLQIIDFSWRSHLQYLEQLRQVIGLRQYGQKDPLSEFKKEAFILFEDLLSKIKGEIIKFLLNLNIVVNTDENKKDEELKDKSKLNNNFKKVGRNEKCPCGSGKKFKYCHGDI